MCVLTRPAVACLLPSLLYLSFSSASTFYSVSLPSPNHLVTLPFLSILFPYQSPNLSLLPLSLPYYSSIPIALSTLPLLLPFQCHLPPRCLRGMVGHKRAGTHLGAKRGVAAWEERTSVRTCLFYCLYCVARVRDYYGVNMLPW